MAKDEICWDAFEGSDDYGVDVDDHLGAIEAAAQAKINAIAASQLPAPRRLSDNKEISEQIVDVRRFWHQRFKKAEEEAKEEHPTADDAALRRAIFEKLGKNHKRYVVADMLLDGLSPAEVSQELGLPERQVATYARMSQMEIRIKELQELKAYKTLLPSLPVMQVLQKYTLSSLALYAQDFFVNAKWQQLNPSDALKLLDLATKVHEMQRLNAGKPTQQIEIVNRSKKELDIVMEKLTKADPEEGGDPFVNYGAKGNRKKAKA